MVAAAVHCSNVPYARHFFDRIPHPNVFLWNAMCKGYADNLHYRDAIFTFRRMQQRGVRPNQFSFPILIKSCCKIAAAPEGGKGVHSLVLKSGFMWNEFVVTALIDLYSRGRDMDSAHLLFVEMPARNVFARTALVAGYILSGDMVSARRIFDQTHERDVVLWDTIISGYAANGNMACARQLFDAMPKWDTDVMCWNTVLTGYANGGELEESERLLAEMPHKNVFSWNGLMGGYARHGRFWEVLGVFNRMLSERDVAPNDTTLVTVLSACARLGALHTGKWVHVYAEGNGFRDNVYMNNSLIDMYAKCGSIEAALHVFKAMGMERRDLITWNSIINGLAMHGRGIQGLDVFDEMRSSGEQPDGITFVGVLSACAHMGLVETGFTYFRLMIDHYSVLPQIEHYGCMVDLLGRAGLLPMAMDFVKNMPMEPDSVIWSALLGACRVYKNLELAEFALKQLIRLEPTNTANYALLSNMYGALGRWEEMARLKLMIKDVGVKKLPGCSLIEVNDGSIEFHSSDQRHFRAGEIYEALNGLTSLLKLVDYDFKPEGLHFDIVCQT